MQIWTNLPSTRPALPFRSKRRKQPSRRRERPPCPIIPFPRASSYSKIFIFFLFRLYKSIAFLSRSKYEGGGAKQGHNPLHTSPNLLFGGFDQSNIEKWIRNKNLFWLVEKYTPLLYKGQ